MRIVLALLALFGALVLVAMTVAPTQPTIRDWYIAYPCPYLDKINTSICEPVRKAAEGLKL